MNERIDIKIAILGCGKETFARMLFLENWTKNRLEPLSKLSEVFLEIDPVNFQNSSKKIIEICRWHNNMLMGQNEIKNIQDLRNKSILPYFYRYTRRTRDLINYNSDNYLNKNILLTFYFIGNNYEEFEKEISDANIIIYLVNVEKPIQENDKLLNYLVKMVKNSENKKYLLTLVNKCDNMNVDGTCEMNSAQQGVIDQIGQIISKKANEESIHSNILPVIPISSKYGYFYRQIFYGNIIEIPKEDKNIISKIFNIRMENIAHDIQRNNAKYFKQCGWITFRNILADILNTKYRSMVDHNLATEIRNLDELPVSVKLINEIKNIRFKAEKMEKIFKKEYGIMVKMVIQKILARMQPMPETIDIINQINDIYRADPTIVKQIDHLKQIFHKKMTDDICKQLYQEKITKENFLPSRIYVMFNKLCDIQPPKEETSRLVSHICELYGNKIRVLMESSENVDWLYDCYFNENEIYKLTSMFSELVSKVNFDQFKIYLIQILLTKLYLAEKCIKYNKEQDNIVNYCRSLRYYLENNITKKYHYLFNLIIDFCSKMIFVGCDNNLKYISENINDIINFKPDQIIHLEKFIIKLIGKKSYNALIAIDANDSCDDSDIEMPNENETMSNNENETMSNFVFTDEDLQSSDNEENDFDLRGDVVEV